MMNSVKIEYCNQYYELQFHLEVKVNSRLTKITPDLAAERALFFLHFSGERKRKQSMRRARRG